MKNFAATVLLISIFFLLVDAAYSSGASDGTMRIASISAPTSTALPKTPLPAVARILYHNFVRPNFQSN